jgi:tripartite-type tricarboxylate transporter receptor subunit TctC
MEDLVNKRRRILLKSVATVPLLSSSISNFVFAKETDFPTRPVKLLVPFVAGGGTDLSARAVAQKLTTIWGQSVVVENIGGGGGNIGTAVAANATPDGYTLLVGSGSIFTVNPHLYKSLPFDPNKDFAPITKLVSGPHVLVVNNSFPAKTLKEFIALLKANPDKYNFASAGIGSQVHMAAEQFLYAAGIEATHIPYKGEGAIYPDIASGRVQFALGNASVVTGQVAAGRVRAIAVTSMTRSPALPSIPSMSESGLDGFENRAWFGLFAPAKTPTAIVEKIYKDTARVLNDPEVKARFEQMGVETVGNTPADFASEIRAESDIWKKVIATRRLSVS